MLTENEKILLVDDDEIFCHVMSRALARRGFVPVACYNSAAAEQAVTEYLFNQAVVDLKIAQESGLHLVKRLKTISPLLEIIVLTGYSSVPTAVEAIKLGAINYFCKPVEVDEVIQSFRNNGSTEEVQLPASAPSLDRLEWEHIQKTLQAYDGNISATARALGLHRRTLQRKLQKHSPG